jgi:hypothetical protein
MPNASATRSSVESLRFGSGLTFRGPAPGTSLSAQAGPSQARANLSTLPAGLVPATVVLVEELPDKHARAVIIRRVAATPQDLILLPKDGATVEALGSSIQALLHTRAKFGDVPTEDMRLVVKKVSKPKHWAEGDLIGARADLERLAASPRRTVDGIGVVHATDVVLAAVAEKRL